MSDVLVTGATGFVGSHVLEAVAQHPALRPIAACRDPRRLLESFTGERRIGDLRDPAYTAAALENVDVVCHAAAWTSVWNHAEQSSELFLQPSLKLLEQAVQSGAKRFIFLSSTSVSLPAGHGEAPEVAEELRLKIWPHMQNVARIEARMRQLSGGSCEMTILRAGLFAGRRYSLGLLPLLVPRLKTHLVPWVRGGRTAMPIIAGEDIGRAFACAAAADSLPGCQVFNVVGPEIPTVRTVLRFLAEEYGLPQPHFSVPFSVAYKFAHLMELLDPLVPWEPLVTRSIVHLLEETGADNARARDILGFEPQVGWREAIRAQMQEMQQRQKTPMRMAKETS